MEYRVCQHYKRSLYRGENNKKSRKYRIFDCWYYNGVSLLNAPILERIKYLPMAAKAINSPLVDYVKYYEAKPETFFDKIDTIFNAGGEGVVLYHKDMRPCEGDTPAWQTLKVKQEIEIDVDCFIYGTEPATQEYTGKEIETWSYWMDHRSGEKMLGNYYLDCSFGMYRVNFCWALHFFCKNNNSMAIKIFTIFTFTFYNL